MEINENSKHELCKKIWRENEQKLRRLCTYKLSGHPDEIEDVMAETALILWTALFEDKIIKYPNSWLYATANNLIKKKYRDLKIERESRVSFDEEDVKNYNLAVGYDSVSCHLPDEMLEKFLIYADSLLTDKEKLLFQYVYEDRLKMKEIAVKFSSTESAVKQRNYRLTRNIKRLLKEFLENY